MNIQTLLESSNEFKSQQLIAEGLQKKWAKTGLLEGLDKRGKLSMSVLLENQAKQIIAEANATNIGGATFTTGEGEQWAGVALPLVRKVFAQIAAKDFLSVQPMNLPSGLAFYLDFKYSDQRNGRMEGDNLYGNVSTATKKMAVNEDVKGGFYGVGQYGYSINEKFNPSASQQNDITVAMAEYFNGQAIVSGSDSMTVHGVEMVGGKEVVIPADTFVRPDFTAVRSFRVVSGSSENDVQKVYDTWNEYTFIDADKNVHIFMDKETAEYVAASGSIDGILYSQQPVDNNRGDFEAASDRAVDQSIVIPEIDIKLASEPIVAKTRKLKAQWTPEFAQDLNAYHSIDAEAEITSLLSEYISMEIDLELLDMLINAAVTVDYWSAKNNNFWNPVTKTFEADDAEGISGYYNTQGGWFQTLGTKAQKVSNKIHQKTLRGGANFMVCSPTVATVLESIPGFAANTDGDKMEFAMGVQKVGSLNSRWKVYKNPYMTENTILMGYKGSQFLEAGAVYAPYVPLLMTPLVYDPETFTPRKGIMTRYAKLVMRPEFYGKIYVAGLETI